jgi:hypothetical protein
VSDPLKDLITEGDWLGIASALAFAGFQPTELPPVEVKPLLCGNCGLEIAPILDYADKPYWNYPAKPYGWHHVAATSNSDAEYKTGCAGEFEGYEAEPALPSVAILPDPPLTASCHRVGEFTLYERVVATCGDREYAKEAL